MKWTIGPPKAPRFLLSCLRVLRDYEHSLYINTPLLERARNLTWPPRVEAREVCVMARHLLLLLLLLLLTLAAAVPTGSRARGGLRSLVPPQPVIALASLPLQLPIGGTTVTATEHLHSFQPRRRAQTVQALPGTPRVRDQIRVQQLQRAHRLSVRC